MNDVDRLLEAARAGDEAARAAVRSSQLVTVCRTSDPSGATRSMPLLDEAASPPIGRPGRRTPRNARTSAGPSRVELTEGAYATLRTEVFEFDGDEVGGGLFGHVAGDTIVVESVVGPNEWTERSSHGFVIDRDRFLAIERATGRQWVGDWHSHAERDPRPSQPDFRGWVAGVRASVGCYCGIVATTWEPGEDWQFFEPRFVSWIATGGECRQATLWKENSWR